MDKFITLILHHGGSFVRDKNRKLDYVGGEIEVWENINPCILNLLDIENKVTQHRGYHNIVRLHYLKPYKGMKLDMNICLNPLTTDKHRIDMINVAKTNGQVDIFFEHVMSVEPQQERQQKGKQEEGTSETHESKLRYAFPPLPGFSSKRIPPPPPRFSSGSKSPIERELSPLQIRGSMDLIPVSSTECPPKRIPPPPEFPPKRIPPPPPLRFSSGFNSPLERESPPLQIRGSVDLIPISFTGFQSKSIPPPPEFPPKRIPPPPPPRFSSGFNSPLERESPPLQIRGLVDLIPVSFTGFSPKRIPPPPEFPPKRIPPPPPRFSSGLKSPLERESPPLQIRGSVDLIPVSFPNCESGSGSCEQKFWHYLPPPPEFQPKKIPPPPPPRFSSGFKSPLERESPPLQIRGSVNLTPVSFPNYEIGFGSCEQKFWHYLPPLPEFQPKNIPPPPEFSSKEYGSVGLIPASFPSCETKSESREQELWHFLPPPPGFQPKKIPPPPGFSGKEYN